MNIFMRTPLLFTAIVFIIGTLLGYYFLVPLVATTPMFGICVAAGLFFRLRRYCVWSTIFALAAVLLFAIINISLRRHSPCALEKLAETYPQDVKITGRVCGEPEIAWSLRSHIGKTTRTNEEEGREENIYKFVMQISRIANPHFTEPVNEKVLVNWCPELSAPLPHSGDIIQFACKVYPLRRATNPGERDFYELQRASGVCARAYIAAKEKIALLEKGSEFSFWRIIGSVRNTFRKTIERSFAGNPDASAFLRAILIGDRTSLSEEKENLFFKTGTAHILSISGLHVGVLAFFLFHILRVFTIRREWRSVFLSVVIVLYCFIGGLSIPLVRTTIMILFYVIGTEFLLRQPNNINILAASAITILLIEPHQIFSVGFQLTFVGCMSIAAFAPAIYILPSKFSRKSILLRRLRGEASYGGGFVYRWLSFSIAAWIGLQPLVTYYFHVFTPFSVLINTVWIPLLLLFMLSFGFLLVVLGSVFISVALAIAYPLECVFGAFDWFLRLCSPSGTYIYLPNRFLPTFGLVALVTFYVALGILMLKVRKLIQLKSVHVVIAFIVAFTIFFSAGLLQSESKETEFTVLDVGKGSAFVLREKGKTILFDCGSLSRVRIGEDVIAPFLWARGENVIDAVFLSHPDADHTNGLFALVDRFRIGSVFVSSYFDADERGRSILRQLKCAGIEFRRAYAGERVSGIAGEVEILAPITGNLFGKELSVNDSSLVVRVNICNKKILLPADIQEAGIFVLTEACKDLSADIVQLPHHGEKDHLMPKLVCAANPQILFVSSSRGESSANLLDLEKTKERIYSTAESGAITFTFHNEKFHIEEFTKRRKEGLTQ